MADLDFWQLLSLIQTNHPDIFQLLTQPGVLKMALDMITAEAQGKPWTEAQITSALQATDWYQQTRPDVRSMQVLRATDPAAYQQRVELVGRQIADLEQQTGIHLDQTGGLGSTGFGFLADAVNNNWDANEIKYRLLASVNTTNAGGSLGAQAAQIKGWANDYAVPLSDQSVMTYARKMQEGAMDQQGVQGYLIEQAKSLFPALSQALDQGITVKQYAAPYLQLAQQELGVNPDTVNLTDQKWMAALNQVDPKTGQRVSMSLDSWLAKLRTDPAYGYDTTQKGRQDATTLAAQLQQKFGAAA